jgi:ribosomal protein S14
MKIDNYKQNKPTLIVRDICQAYPEVPADFVYQVLLNRGAFKWFTVRRQLIKLKDTWRDKVSMLNCKKTQREKGYLEALQECRQQVRDLCHSSRMQAPDFDRHAQRYLEKERCQNVKAAGKNSGCTSIM